MIISVQNQKGGVGKTTIATHLCQALALRKARVLLIDSDPQGSSRDWAAARSDEPLFSVVGFDRPTIHKEIKDLAKGYDYVVIDGPPRVTDLARSAIMAADIILIPVQPSPYDIWAAQDVIEIIKEASVFKENLKSVFVINRKIANTAIGRDATEAITNFEIPVLKSQISQRVAFAETASSGTTVLDMGGGQNNAAAKEINSFVDELMEFINA
jgi:chromosome partitioning protein